MQFIKTITQSKANLSNSETQYQYWQEKLRSSIEDVLRTVRLYHIRASNFNQILNISLGEDAADVVSALADWMNNHTVSSSDLQNILNNGNPLPTKLEDALLLLVPVIKKLLRDMASETTDTGSMLDNTILCFLFLRNYVLQLVPDSIGPSYVDLTNVFCQKCTYLVGAKLQYDNAQASTLLAGIKDQMGKILLILR